MRWGSATYRSWLSRLALRLDMPGSCEQAGAARFGLGLARPCRGMLGDRLPNRRRRGEAARFLQRDQYARITRRNIDQPVRHGLDQFHKLRRIGLAAKFADEAAGR